MNETLSKLLWLLWLNLYRSSFATLTCWTFWTILASHDSGFLLWGKRESIFSFCMVKPFLKTKSKRSSHFWVTLQKRTKMQPPEKKYREWEELIKNKLSKGTAGLKLKLSEVSLLQMQTIQKLETVWQKEKIQIFTNFLQWYNKRDFVPNCKALQGLVDAFHLNEGFWHHEPWLNFVQSLKLLSAKVY